MGKLLAGRLNKVVDFTRRRPGRDELGGEDPIFDPLFTAMCEVRPLSGREVFTAMEHAQVVDAVIELRYPGHEDLTASDRATVQGPQGGVYDIEGVVTPEQAGEALQLRARRVDHPPTVAANRST